MLGECISLAKLFCQDVYLNCIFVLIVSVFSSPTKWFYHCSIFVSDIYKKGSSIIQKERNQDCCKTKRFIFVTLQRVMMPSMDTDPGSIHGWIRFQCFCVTIAKDSDWAAPSLWTWSQKWAVKYLNMSAIPLSDPPVSAIQNHPCTVMSLRQSNKKWQMHLLWFILSFLFLNKILIILLKVLCVVVISG